MARKRASMREGPLAELFRKTEAAQRGQDPDEEQPTVEAVEQPRDRRAQAALEETVDHVHDFADEPPLRAVETEATIAPAPDPAPQSAHAEPYPDTDSEQAASRAAARYFQT